MLSLADLFNPAETVSAPASTSSPWLQQTVIPPGVTVKHNVKLNRDTTLTELWIYPPGFLLEYPHTSSSLEQAIGHLFTMQGFSWTCPSHDFAYSLGDPRGGTSNVKVYPLADNEGNQVLCKRRFRTCQGIKVCPFVDPALSNEWHSAVTRDSLKLSWRLMAAEFQQLIGQ
ncbi:hypothetical protein C8J56DRAFT_1056935 [Mycena floridula]|nr:hypothetical protein C8J56DRAFT_1056935 [Mycena floridula]